MPRLRDLIVATVSIATTVAFLTLFRFPGTFDYVHYHTFLFQEGNNEVPGDQAIQLRRTPYKKCMHCLEPEFDPQAHFYLHAFKTCDVNISLSEALEANQTTIYFLHQRKAGFARCCT